MSFNEFLEQWATNHNQKGFKMIKSDAPRVLRRTLGRDRGLTPEHHSRDPRDLPGPPREVLETRQGPPKDPRPSGGHFGDPRNWANFEFGPPNEENIT